MLPEIVFFIYPSKSFVNWDEKIRDKILKAPFSLKINPQKTVVSQFYYNDEKIRYITKTELCLDYSERHYLKYLGLEFDGNQVLLKPASLSKFYREMKMAVRRKANRANAAKRYNNKYPKRKTKVTQLYLSKLYSRYTYLGKNKAKSNYLSYANRAAKIIYQI